MIEAVADTLDGRVVSRDDLHEALRRRLPAELLPWRARRRKPPPGGPAPHRGCTSAELI